MMHTRGKRRYPIIGLINLGSDERARRRRHVASNLKTRRTGAQGHLLLDCGCLREYRFLRTRSAKTGIQQTFA